MAIIRLHLLVAGSIFVSVRYPIFIAMGLIILNATTILQIPIISKDTTRLDVIVFGAASCGLYLQPHLFTPGILSLLLAVMWVGVFLLRSHIVSVLHLEEKEVEPDRGKESNLEEEIIPKSKEEDMVVGKEQKVVYEGVRKVVYEEVGREEEEKEEEEEEKNLVVTLGTEVGYYNEMVQRIVPLFEKQREKNYQFAVLYLSSERKLSIENTKFRTRLNEVIDPYEATDCSESTFPGDDNLGNFIAGRPRTRHHAEKCILDRFETLWKCYSSTNSEPCHHIVLYTWMLPCNYCKEKIIRILGPLCSEECQITLVFTIIQKNVTEHDALKIIAELLFKGVGVEIREYRKKLLRKFTLSSMSYDS